MNLKYYLRGLGLGIIVTAVFLGLTVGKRDQTMSDAQIIARARELGMIENTVLSQYSETNNETDEKPQPDAAQTDTAEPEIEQPETQQPETTEDIAPEEVQAEEQMPAKEEPQAAQETEQAQPDTEPEMESVEADKAAETAFSVQKGEDSHAVSQRLEDAGVVSSAKEFDQYLIQNGHDKRISVGDYSIPPDADFETIVKIITRQ